MVSMMAQTSVLQLEVKVEGAHKAAQQLVHICAHTHSTNKFTAMQNRTCTTPFPLLFIPEIDDGPEEALVVLRCTES